MNERNSYKLDLVTLVEVIAAGVIGYIFRQLMDLIGLPIWFQLIALLLLLLLLLRLHRLLRARLAHKG